MVQVGHRLHSFYARKALSTLESLLINKIYHKWENLYVQLRFATPIRIIFLVLIQKWLMSVKSLD